MKRWFTLVEVLVVIVIVWILFQSFLSFWSRNDRKINATACVNSVYWTFRNFVDESFTWKWIYSGEEIIFPDSYHVERTIWDNKITFKYGTGTSYIENIIYFTWNWIDERYRCFSRDYYVYQTWNITKITMNKWFVKQWNTRSFIINDDPTMFTWYLNYYISDIDDSERRILWRILVDSRTQKVLLWKCMASTWTDTKECKEWERTN